jgi:Skp family chaperone for outer membrane proteins
MRKVAIWILALGFVAAPAAFALAGLDDNKPANSDSTKAADSTKSTDNTKPTDSAKVPAPAGDSAKTLTPTTNGAAPSSAELATEIEQLRTLLRQQADQLDRQQREMAEMKASLDRVSASANSAASTGSANVAPGGVSGTVTSAGTVSMPAGTPGAVASASPASVPASGAAQGGGTPEHSPLSFKIGDASFTPLGFIDFTGVYRTEATGNGIGTTFNGIPYINAAAGGSGPVGYGETRFSVQNSRVGIRVDAPVGSAKITGYLEADFLGLIAANANVTSNSDSLRMRVYFADYRRGPWEVLGGQDWSMLTPNRKGISPFPSDIFYSQDMDTNYQVGLTWKRTPQVRFLYHPNDSWTFGVSAENPDTLLTSSVTVPTLFTPVNGQVDLTSGGTLATPTTPGFIPDFIFKAAYDGKVGEKLMHVEAAGLFREFKLFTPASITGAGNQTRTTAGVGGSLNFNLELVKNFHLIGTTFWSDGGGIYIIGSGPDIVVRQATLTSPFVPSPVHAYSGIGGFEWQATKGTFIDAYYGGAYYGRDFSINPSNPSGAPVGYGFVGSAVTNNRAIQEATVGWTQTFWQNPNYGKFQLITQGSYLSRNPWAAVTGGPRDAHMFMVYMDLRYTLP